MTETYDPITATKSWPYHLGVVVRAVRTIVAAHRPGMVAHIDRCMDLIPHHPEAALAEILSASSGSCAWAEVHRPDDHRRFVAAFHSLTLPGGRLTPIGPDAIPVALRAHFWAGWLSSVDCG